MKPTKKEYKEIVEAIKNQSETIMPDVLEDDYLSGRIIIHRKYMPDCPSWCGDIAYVVFGEVCYQTILLKNGHIGYGSGWKIYKEINEKEMTSYSN